MEFRLGQSPEIAEYLVCTYDPIGAVYEFSLYTRTMDTGWSDSPAFSARSHDDWEVILDRPGVVEVEHMNTFPVNVVNIVRVCRDKMKIHLEDTNGEVGTWDVWQTHSYGVIVE